jgi:PAS domain S-box-containing protein
MPSFGAAWRLGAERVKSVSSPDVDRSHLLVRLAQAGDLAEAVRVLVESGLAPAGMVRGALLLEAQGELTPVESWGWEPDQLDRLRFPLDDGAPAALALRAGQPARMDAGTDPLAASLGVGQLTMLPLPRRVADPGVYGVLLLDTTDRNPDQVEQVTELLRDAGPLLARCGEVDEIRRQSFQLERHRELLTAIVNALPDPVLVTNTDNEVLLENRRAESLLTTSEADSEGRRRAVEINNLLLSSFLSRSGMEARESGSRELNLVDPTEGGDLLFEVLSTPLLASAFPQGATVAVLREVTDLKRAAAELERQFKRVRQAELKSRRERDRLNLILETVGDPILVTDDQANIILMNREAERLFEVPAGTDLRDRRRQEVRANDTKFSSFISDLALSPDTTRVAEMQLADPETGGDFPAEVVSGKIFNERSEMAAIVSIVHDLTKVVENERLAAELAHLNEGLEDRVRSATNELEERNRQLEWQRQELERAYRLKSEFLASMSHELRTPINALLGYTSLMRDRIYGELTSRQEEALQRMYSASQHLLELVNDVLDLAKIEAGKMPIHTERVDLSLLVREISLTIEPMVRRKNLAYEVQIEPSLPPIETDRTKVKQILLNLLSNATKFTPKGRIELAVRNPASGSGVEVVVSDTGIGIKREDMDKIFEDFRQVDQSSTREYGGTGLGLSITRKLLSLLGGTIRVQSCLGEGSTFTVWLPLRGKDISSDEQLARTTMGEHRTVVQIVEDRPENC